MPVARFFSAHLQQERKASPLLRESNGISVSLEVPRAEQGECQRRVSRHGLWCLILVKQTDVCVTGEAVSNHRPESLREGALKEYLVGCLDGSLADKAERLFGGQDVLTRALDMSQVKNCTFDGAKFF